MAITATITVPESASLADLMTAAVAGVGAAAVAGARLPPDQAGPEVSRTAVAMSILGGLYAAKGDWEQVLRTAKDMADDDPIMTGVPAGEYPLTSLPDILDGLMLVAGDGLAVAERLALSRAGRQITEQLGNLRRLQT